MQITFPEINYKTPLKIDKSNNSLFNDDRSYIDGARLYTAHFGTLSNVIFLKYVDCEKVMKYIIEKYADLIVDRHYRHDILLDRKKKFEVDNEILILKNEMMIDIDFSRSVIIHFSRESKSIAEKIAEELKRFKQKNKEKYNSIYLVYRTSDGLDTTNIEVPKPKLKINANYNDELTPLHTNIIKQLRGKRQSGLYLFHGTPGTGKSTYIRYLVHCINKPIIFLSPKFASNLDGPDFTKLLIDNSNSVFVIEDAEELLVSRDAGDSSNISTVLNLTDGLLGEGLGIQIICTFNTDISRLDKALLRKGRLKVLYEFGALSVEKSNNLLKSLNQQYVTTIPMTLSDIYNVNDNGFEFKNKRKAIGFCSFDA